jgi:hypothetical protein
MSGELTDYFVHAGTFNATPPVLDQRHIGRLLRSSRNARGRRVTSPRREKPRAGRTPSSLCRVTYEMMEAAFRPAARTGAMPDWMEPFTRTHESGRRPEHIRPPYYTAAQESSGTLGGTTAR